MSGFVTPSLFPAWSIRPTSPLSKKANRSTFAATPIRGNRARRSNFPTASAEPTLPFPNPEENGAQTEVELPKETLVAAEDAAKNEMPKVVPSNEALDEDKAGLESAVGAVPTAKETEGSLWINSVVLARGNAVPIQLLEDWRKEGEEKLEGLPLPSRRQESWRFTDMRSLYGMRFKAIEEECSVDVGQFAPKEAGIKLVFVDGEFRKELSSGMDDLLSAGGYAGGLEGFKGDLSSVKNAFVSTETSSSEGELFPSLNAAIARDVALIELPKNYQEEKPICLIYASTGGSEGSAAAISAARIAIIAGECSQASIMEYYVSAGGDERPFFFSSASTGVIAHSGANISHFAVNETGNHGHHVAHMHATVQRDASYNYKTIAASGAVSRTVCGIDLNDSGAHGSVKGVTVVDQKRVCDVHSRISHNAPQTSSDQLQKNIAAERGRAIFNGKILVNREANGTESNQLCRSLLLSDKARVDAMPVLEISNPDVQCSHGATVSDLDEEQMFYLRSRGLTIDQGRSLLLESFALEVLEDVPISLVSDHVRRSAKKLAPNVQARDVQFVNFSSI